MPRWLWLVVVVSLSAGCSCSDGVGPGADPDGAIGPRTDARAAGGCAGDGDCAGEQVCHPGSRTCVTPGATCTTHADCSEGAFCDDAAERCLAGTPGSPCATDENCIDQCLAGLCGCSGLAHEQELAAGPLDVYLVLDRTGSMGRDCSYTHGDTAPVSSKACFATYALSDYLIDVTPTVDTRLAFQFMSQEDDCDGTPYETPLVDFTPLPVAPSHALVREISDETFAGGLGTHIEGALRGIAAFTSARRTAGREIIGVLVTDGDPSGCEEDIDTLRTIIEDHFTATGIRTFVIGMEGATESNLERLATAGGAEPHDDWCGDVGPPCHYWNVGNGSGDAVASALQAILRMAVPLPCEFGVVDLTPPPGETLDFGRVNVTLTQGGTTTTIGRVTDEAACPGDRPAWYYDDPTSPAAIHLCPNACTLVSGAADGARVDVVVGCQDTVVLI
jgi:hypothetical protein